MSDTYEYRFTATGTEAEADGSYLGCLLRQEQCRELALERTAAPAAPLGTREMDCEALTETEPGDAVLVRVRVTGTAPGELELTYHQYKQGAHGEEVLVARGRERVAGISPSILSTPAGSSA
ncbi:hypothetical protein [Streptomyces drozdowiczii]|uniref:Uncharacterized protein n=1 Tax=Streptomyces drozdowiczii TaxID=202862 RepID=A0ABY6Q162_9ACTN|nr:hypothetical protein [Streptomyces drozdowiczii]MCX0241704.1 hypothetical protein [Streptomyces drozdowiczii]UZK58074.1 hypothetical protein NEH16_31910 [Streptomyces drozdowiczii]